jgi:asparagine synthase (glutamine-hydrolysing)
MCGIAGYLGPCDAASAAAVRSINDHQVHRGPDAEGMWTSPLVNGVGAVLAHRRLAIIDTSADGIQPMHDETNGNAIVFNGEIYNFRALRDELAANGLPCRTRTDTEVILKAYTRWGQGCVERLRGMFAFALWDAKERRLLLARDRLGIKPLYYASPKRAGQGPCLVFSSEIRALLSTELIARRLDDVGVATYLWNGFVIGPSTIVDGISLLPAGAAALVDPLKPAVEPRRFWQIPREAPATPRTAEDVGETLKEAIAQHLVSDVPLGIFLSGGVDSSAIASLASRCATAGVKTFNISFGETEFDEAKYARAVASALGTDHAELRLTGADLLRRLPEALNGIDQPTFDGINTYFVSRVTRDAGVTVALAGTGGDEVFGGYRSFVDVPRARRVSDAWPFPRPRIGKVLAWLQGRSDVPSQTRWGKLDDVLGTRGRIVDVYQVAYSIFTTDFLRRLSPSALGARTKYGLPDEEHTELERLVAGRTDLAAVSALELSCFISERLLRDTDAASMAASLEVRVPLLDHAVIEAAFGVPDERRFGRLRTKELLRSIALDNLDPKLFDRPKAGFVLPIDRWARLELKGVMEETLQDAQLCRNIGIEPSAAAKLWKAFLERRNGVYWTRIWAMFVLLWWCREQRMQIA